MANLESDNRDSTVVLEAFGDGEEAMNAMELARSPAHEGLKGADDLLSQRGITTGRVEVVLNGRDQGHKVILAPHGTL